MPSGLLMDAWCCTCTHLTWYIPLYYDTSVLNIPTPPSMREIGDHFNQLLGYYTYKTQFDKLKKQNLQVLPFVLFFWVLNDMVQQPVLMMWAFFVVFANNKWFMQTIFRSAWSYMLIPYQEYNIFYNGV